MTKNENDVFGGVKAPLEGCDRSRLSGFQKYFSQRKEHFRDVFGVQYTDKDAALAFRKYELK